MAAVPRFDPVGVLTLREIRSFIRRSSARGGVAFFGLLYVLGSLFLGGMIVLGDIRGGYTFSIVWGGTAGSWNYPGVLFVGPWGVVSLPFFATFSMVVVGVGVGYGMTVAFLLVIRLVRNRARDSAGSSAPGAIAGLTPAMISLVTLGACCSTTAAATAGVGLVAQASGTSASTLLLNNWYLGVFQIVVVWVALLAQEMLLIVYAGLFGRPTEGTGTASATGGYRMDVRFVSVGLLRGLLMGAGVVWALAVLAEWTTINPSTAGAGYWFQWVFQHWLVAGFAVSAALFPTASVTALQRARHGWGWTFPLLLAVASVSLILWVPPPLPVWGVDGLFNQLLGAFGAPAAWGSIAPGPVGGAALVLRWGLEYLLLGVFTAVAALAPDRLRVWLRSPTPIEEPAAPLVISTDPTTVPGVRPLDPRPSSASHPELP